jgi:streptogramin lyase
MMRAFAVAGLMLWASAGFAQDLRPFADLGDHIEFDVWGGVIETTGDAVWTYDHPNGRLVRIDAASGAVSESTLPGYVGFQYPFVVGEDALWLPDLGTSSVIKIDPATGAELAVMAPGTMRSNGAAAGHGSLWVGGYDRDTDKHFVIRYDAGTGAELARIPSSEPIFNVIAAGEYVWVNRLRHLDRIDPATNRFIGGAPSAEYDYPMWTGEGFLWVQTLGGDFLSQIDPNTGAIVHDVALGNESPARVAVGEGSVWMATQGLKLLRIDVATGTVADAYVSPTAVGLAVAGGFLWVLNAEVEKIWRVAIPGAAPPTGPADKAAPPPKVAPKKG